MTPAVWLAVVVALAILTAGGYLIHRWGPGIVRRSLRCPEKNVQAEIEVLRKEGSFGAILNDDVLSCSLLPGGVDCDKKCLGTG